MFLFWSKNAFALFYVCFILLLYYLFIFATVKGKELLTAKNVSVFGVILVRIFPALSRIRTEYGEIRSISSLRIQSECGKNEDQNNSEYGQFLRSVC